MTNSELERKLDSAIEYLQDELKQIRTGRANPSVLDEIKVEAYGSKMGLKEIGSVSVLDSQTLQITPWDKSLLEDVGKAIQKSDLQLNPVVKSDVILVPIPSLTEERRKEFTHLASGKVEETKNSIRHIRREAMDDIEKDFDNKKFGEDEKFSLIDDVENTIKKYTKKAEEIAEKKKEDIMTV